MKKTMIALAFAALSSSLWAGGVDKGGHYGERLQQELNLTPEQQQQVQAIFEQERQKQVALRTETQTALNAVLSAEQQAKLEQLKQDRPGRRGDGRRGPALEADAVQP